MPAPSAIEPMAARYRRPDWVRRINAMGASVGGARRLVPLDADAMLEQAQASLGIARPGDFGDPKWRERFSRLVAALDACDMHVVGRLLTRQELMRSQRTRLLLARAWDAQPAIAREKVAAPVIVTGPARSGTTITFELLWLDPALRAPTAWEALHPFALPDASGGDERPLLAECEQELWADVQPEFAAIHELRSDLPVECVTLTAPCFCGPHWPMVSRIDPMLGDIEEMYRFHRRILQTMQAEGAQRAGGERSSENAPDPRTWLLKTPGHLMTLDLLFQTYPDAWIVQTHRDPVKTMPSTVSTTAMIQWMRMDDVDVAALAAGIEGAFSFALNSVAERRAAGSLPKRFVDVHFQELLRDPVATLRAAYAAMEREFTPEHAERVRRYLAAKPQGKFGKHRYSPEEWGFEAGELRRRLAPYVEYFGVALE